MRHLLKRRDFVKAILAGTLSIPLLLEGLSQSIQAQPRFEKKDLIWLKGQSSSIHEPGYWNIPEMHEFIYKFFNVFPASTLDNLKNEINDKAIIMVSGLLEREDHNIINLKRIISNARIVLLLGNEACYGLNDTDNWILLDKELLLPEGIPFIKLPGFPVSARHILGTLNHLILFGVPELDVERRPLMFFNKIICDRCEYRSNFEKGDFLSYYGEKEGCLYLLGCKGPVVKNSCPIDYWNETNQWCVKVGSPCTGCSESVFPDHSGLGMYGQISSEIAGVNSNLVQHAEKITKGALAITASGLLIHAVTRRGDSKVEIQMNQTYKDEN